MTVYTTQLQAGLGAIEETKILLELWQEGMTSGELLQVVLKSGQFPMMSARRLRNLISECFAPRYLAHEPAPARLLKAVKPYFHRREFEQLLFVYACRANTVLADFVRGVYWDAYAAGRELLSNEAAYAFVVRANQDGKTSTSWSDSTVERVARYLTGACADFGLLERGAKSTRRILTYRIEPRVAAFLAYELHFSGHGDNAVLSHADWGLFGLERLDVLEELKRLALRNLVIIQAAGGVTKISWRYESMEGLLDVLTRDQL
jgi:hypothetical protein